MAELPSERDLLLTSTPIDPGEAGWSAFASHVLGRGAGCPSVLSWLDLRDGHLAAEEAGALRVHLSGCPYCRACHEGVTRPRDVARAASDLATLSGALRPASPDEAQPIRVAAHDSSVFASQSLAHSFYFFQLLDNGNLSEALGELRHCLPTWLEGVGLDPHRADDLWDHLLERVQAEGKLPTGGLAACTESFARQVLGLSGFTWALSAEQRRVLLYRCALILLERAPETTDAERRFISLARQTTTSWRDFGKVSQLADAPADSYLDVAARDLAPRGRKVERTLARASILGIAC